MKKRKLFLESGEEFTGEGFGASRDGVCELVFNTSPVGYQEIVSDPSYTDQYVVMAYPLIGNYGINEDDFETRKPTIGGLVVRDYNDHPSNFRSSRTLSELMCEYGIPGISGVDTRAIVRQIRDFGSQLSLMTDEDISADEAVKKIKAHAVPHDAVSRVSRSTAERFDVENISKLGQIKIESAEKKYKVAAIDFGIKENIIRSLVGRGCEVMVFPWNVTAGEIGAYAPDGVFLSNGPGDPADVDCAVEMLKIIRGSYPVFGICLGHQIIARSYGANTFKLKFGHRGGNHPVRELSTGQIEMTSQNHSYAVDEKSLTGTGLSVTHINLLDHTIEGLSCEKDGVFCVQYHPEACPGPQEGSHLFDKFIKLMEVRHG